MVSELGMCAAGCFNRFIVVAQPAGFDKSRVGRRRMAVAVVR